MENRISSNLAPQSADVIHEATATIEQNLPTMVNLTPEERHDMPKMGDKTFSFVTKALEYAKQNPQVIPPFLDVIEFEKDVILVADLKKVLRPLQQLVEKLDDTTLLAGSEAYAAALIFYNAVKSSAKAGVPGMKTIADDLHARFAVKSKPAEVPTGAN